MGHTGAQLDLREDLREFIGERATVIEAITPRAGGKVEFHGTNWEACADGDIAAGAVCERPLLARKRGDKDEHI